MSQQYHSLSESDCSDTELGTNSGPSASSDNKVQSSTRNSPSAVAAKKLKIAKAKADKLEKLKIKEKYKHISPGSCLNYLSLSVDESIINNSAFNGVIAELGKSQVPIEIHKGNSDTVTWNRKQLSGECIEQSHVLILWDHVTLLQNIIKSNINGFFSELMTTKPSYRVYLAIYGLRDYCRRVKRKSKLTEKEKAINILPSRDKIEQILCEMQLMNGISHRLFDDQLALVTFINQLTKSIGEEPYRKEKEKHELEKTSYIHGSSRFCVKIDKQNNGMKRLWVQQLAQLPMSSLDYAKAIATLYPSPLALYKAYNALDSKEERENLLENIAIGREGSKKRLGPEMSKKIYLLFSTQDIHC